MTARPLPLLLGALGVGAACVLAFYATSVWNTPYLYDYMGRQHPENPPVRMNNLTGSLQYWDAKTRLWGSQRPEDQFPHYPVEGMYHR